LPFSNCIPQGSLSTVFEIRKAASLNKFFTSPVKKRELKKLINERAREKGILFVELRHRGPHEVYLLGKTQIQFGKHTEIKDGEFWSIVKDCEAELGARWWK